MEPNSSKPSIPVLVYATFNNKVREKSNFPLSICEYCIIKSFSFCPRQIYIYYDIHLPSMLTENFSPHLGNFMRGFDLQEIAKNIPKSSEQYKYIAELLSSPMTGAKIKKLTEFCLYVRTDLAQASTPKSIDC